MRKGYIKLDMKKLENRNHTIISTTEALKEETPIQWSNNVLTGENKILIDKRGIHEVCVK